MSQWPKDNKLTSVFQNIETKIRIFYRTSKGNFQFPKRKGYVHLEDDNVEVRILVIRFLILS